MAKLEQHKAGDTPAKQREHIRQEELGSEMLTWNQNQPHSPRALIPVPS